MESLVGLGVCLSSRPLTPGFCMSTFCMAAFLLKLSEALSV